MEPHRSISPIRSDSSEPRSLSSASSSSSFSSRLSSASSRVALSVERPARFHATATEPHWRRTRTRGRSGESPPRSRPRTFPADAPAPGNCTSPEVVVTGVPQRAGVKEVLRSLHSMLEEKRRPTTPCTIVDGQKGDLRSGVSTVYVRFQNEKEAEEALRLCEGRLTVTLQDHAVMCSVLPSSGAHTVSAPATDPPVEQEKAKPVLPEALQHETWKPPQSFATSEAKSTYLSLLSSHWSHLSDAQKHYYDEVVKAALLNKQTASPKLTPAVSAGSMTPEQIKELVESRKAAACSSRAVERGNTNPSTLEEIKAAIALRTSAAAKLQAGGPLPGPNSAESKDTSQWPNGSGKTQTKSDKGMQYFQGFLVPPPCRGGTILELKESDSSMNHWKAAEFEVAFYVGRRILNRSILP